MERITFISLLLTAVFSSSSCLERQYHFVNQNMTWTEAQKYCRENYTNLATINNMNDTQELQKKVNNQTNLVWIGLQRTNNYTWKWSLGNPVLYKGNNSQHQNWENVSSSNLEAGDCVSMKINGTWSSHPCRDSFKLPFICYNDSSEGYVPVMYSLNWREAQRYCRVNYTDLASVTNESEYQKIQQIIQNQTGQNQTGQYDVWIGLFRDSWEWSDDSTSSFRNWGNDEPNNEPNNKICTTLSAQKDEGQWIDDPCNNVYPFVCYDDKLFVIRENKTWKDALRYCRENQMDLVSVESDWMQRRVMNVVKDTSSAELWLGLRHSCTLGLWFWVSGEIMCYHNWAPGNGTGLEDCSEGVRAGALLSRGDQRWISLPETHQLNFICSKY